MSSSPYPYSDARCAALIRSLSAERFDTFLVAAGDADRIGGLQRYMWNAAVAARFHGPLHLLEVTVRNAVHDRLSAKYGGAWFDLGLLSSSERSAVNDAKVYLLNRREPTTPGKVVAEVSFRFWVGLLSRKYSALWKTDLARLFNPRLDRAQLHDDLDRLRTLRNRIAHHEPLIHRNLMQDLARIQRIVIALSPAMFDWLQWHQRVDEYFATPYSDISSF